jgi:hypothetical protein
VIDIEVGKLGIRNTVKNKTDEILTPIHLNIKCSYFQTSGEFWLQESGPPVVSSN